MINHEDRKGCYVCLILRSLRDLRGKLPRAGSEVGGELGEH